MSDSNGSGSLKRARSNSPPAGGRKAGDDRPQGAGKKQNTGRQQVSDASGASSGSAAAAKGLGANAKMEGSNGDNSVARESASRAEATTTNATPTVSGEHPTAPDSAAPQITIKALIVTQDASIIIGKAGAHIKEIREKAGARVSVSDQIPGNPERILNITGPLDAVSKVGFVLPSH